MTLPVQAQATQERVQDLLVRVMDALHDENAPDAVWAAVTEGLSDSNKDFWGVSSNAMLAKEFRWRYLKHFESIIHLTDDPDDEP